MEHVYFGEFGSWQDVMEQFQVPEQDRPVPDQVIFASYDCPEYEGYAEVIYRIGDRYFWASGSHCSCYGLEDQWEPEEYSRDQLALVVLRQGQFYYSENPDDVRAMILERLSQ